MRVITFYSYKGGVGRTLAATNFAVYLASLQKKVLVLDFDFEAPGVDSKLLPEGVGRRTRGLVDYILEFQETGHAPPISEFLLETTVASGEQERKLWLIPAGDYAGDLYFRDLHRIRWAELFSEELQGVAFFQHLLQSIRDVVEPDFLIVDSRTGIGEISGLCTQQLADEVVMLTSLAAESVRMTRLIRDRIVGSEIAKRLDKSVDVKVVVSRVPRPSGDLQQYKESVSRRLDVALEKLFFLFSSPQLESEEFLAVSSPRRDEALLGNYLQLFHGLDVDLASDRIRDEIRHASAQLLLMRLEEAEQRVLDLAALYPHPEAYRAAMRYFILRDNPRSARRYAHKVLDVVSNDKEAVDYLRQLVISPRYGFTSTAANAAETLREDLKRVLEVTDLAALEPAERVSLADRLEDADMTESSHSLAAAALLDPISKDVQERALGIAVRTAMRLKKYEFVNTAVDVYTVDRMPVHVNYRPIIEFREMAGDLQVAFELALRNLSFRPTLDGLRLAMRFIDDESARARFEMALRHAEGEPEPGFYDELRRIGLSTIADDMMIRARGRRRPSG